jgi:O-antigen/teichoic acid export membrane protein
VLNRQRSQRLALVATQALCEGSAFIRNLILARLIGADEMGLAVALALAIRIFEMASDFSLDRLLVQVEERALPPMRRTVHLLQLAKGGLMAAAAIALALPVSRALNPALDPAVFALAALALAIRGASNFDFRERQRRGDYVAALSVEGGSTLFATLACLPLAWALRDHSVLAWVLVLQAGAFCALSHIVASTPFAIGLDRTLLSRCLRYGVPLALNGALMFLALQGDRLVVALHFSPVELARFALAAQLTLLPALIGARYLLASELPRLARLAQQDKGFGSHWLALLQRAALFSILGALLLGLTGNILIGGLYGDAYRVAPEVLWLLAAGAAIRLVRAVPGTAIMALERTRFLFLSNLPRLVTLAAAFWFAATGGAMATIVAIAVLGEALSLLVALGALAGLREKTSGKAVHRLAEGL